ncbi:GNAT family N-acetyltransferase [Micromonospora sp. NPDC049102]|uniref:GNAT family N-acetyltransferase n=1 Tax=Micromonospora sp. NPDC049102 TaxID=3364265 RepID=UPI00371F773B
MIRDEHFGEGRYEESERTIQRLLGIERDLVPVRGVGVEAEADWDNLRTPETYLGFDRGEHFASPNGPALDERRAYQVPESLGLNQWALAGEWTTGSENVVLDRAGGGIAFRFHARDAHLVLAPGAGQPIPFRVLLDGDAPGPSHGVDVDEGGVGVLADGRLYQLVRQGGAVRDWYLGVLGTHPDSAGRGWGRAVMRAGLARAAADGLPAILETSKPANVELYRRAGWEVVGSLAEPVPTWVMQQPRR